MKQNNKSNTWILSSLVLTIISVIGTIFIYSKLPLQIPTHFGISGQPDAWSDKPFIFFTALLPVALIGLLYITPKIDPKRSSYAKHAKAYNILILAITLFLIGIHWLTIFFALGYNLSIDKFIMIGLGILFIILGNYMPQVRSNYTFGVKTPWALADENNWRATQRFGGYMFIVMGICSLLLIFVPAQIAFILLMIVIFGGTISCFLYSYFYFKKHGNWK